VKQIRPKFTDETLFGQMQVCSYLFVINQALSGKMLFYTMPVREDEIRQHFVRFFLRSVIRISISNHCSRFHKAFYS
jgi:hypothetical protein